MPASGFFTELRKRKVFQVAAIYSAVAWGVTEKANLSLRAIIPRGRSSNS
ncbi:MAG: hypothetical protein IID60_06220 [Proteobacteria bacterium]|nr:hypothetical protein [Pseudomonadota bacterium]